MLPLATRWSIQPWYSSGPTPWVKATTGALRGVGCFGSKIVTLPGEPLTCAIGWVTEGAVDPARSPAGPPAVQPAHARAASRPAKPRPRHVLGPLRADPTIGRLQERECHLLRPRSIFAPDPEHGNPLHGAWRSGRGAVTLAP